MGICHVLYRQIELDKKGELYLSEKRKTRICEKVITPDIRKQLGRLDRTANQIPEQHFPAKRYTHAGSFHE